MFPLKLTELCQREVFRMDIPPVPVEMVAMKNLKQMQMFFNDMAKRHPQIVEDSSFKNRSCADIRFRLLTDEDHGGISQLISSYSKQTDLYADPFCGYYGGLIGHGPLVAFAVSRTYHPLPSPSPSPSHVRMCLTHSIAGSLIGGDWDCLDACWVALSKAEPELGPSDVLKMFLSSNGRLSIYGTEFGFTPMVMEWATQKADEQTVRDILVQQSNVFKTFANYKFALRMAPSGFKVGPIDHTFAMASFCNNTYLFKWLMQKGEQPSATACLLASLHNADSADMMQICLDKGYLRDAIRWTSAKNASGSIKLIYFWCLLCNNRRALNICNQELNKPSSAWKLDMLHYGTMKELLHADRGSTWLFQRMTSPVLVDLVDYLGGPERFINIHYMSLNEHYRCDYPPFSAVHCLLCGVHCIHSVFKCIDRTMVRLEYVDSVMWLQSFAASNQCTTLHQWCTEQLSA